MWYETTGVEIRSLYGHSGQINEITVNSVGNTRYIVTASQDKTAIIWNYDTGTVSYSHNFLKNILKKNIHIFKIK